MSLAAVTEQKKASKGIRLANALHRASSVRGIDAGWRTP